MTIAHSLERILVVPRNGYVNRLQAWASSAILGAELDVPVSVAWEPQAVAPATPADLFSDRLVSVAFVTSTAAEHMIGGRHEELPRYLNVLPERRLVVLAGHDLGEQALIDQLPRALADDCQPTQLVVIAGGKFHLPGAGDPIRQRENFYSQLEWSQAISEPTTRALGQHGPYLGLHIRGTDRSVTAPSDRVIRESVNALRDRTGLSSLFIAADAGNTREQWYGACSELGFTPWSAPVSTYDRTAAAAGIDAMIDWVLLSHAQAIAYSATSSFAEEAAVATGRFDQCQAATASPGLQRARRFLALSRLAITYPGRLRNPS